ncbi:hypothetical protein [Methylomonas rivi]|uniref:Uncharacterized protein n=1 Tax=Methylomonas rivi TaxID=2952226 RepID=A0ABT1UA37_9GAMM|nr:hypothetical protein [Methylomonas sp. WSC-6]MCQ8129936.1 hypothetical protein [Methylomonas sp. WSC-6]
MAFTTEYATKDDIEKYHLDELQKKYHLANPGLDWTYDKEKNVFLMLSMNGRGVESNIKIFLFSWKGEIYSYSFSITWEKETNTLSWTMHRVGGEPKFESDEVKQKYEDIYADLKEALQSYGSAGSANRKSYIHQFSNF